MTSRFIIRISLDVGPSVSVTSEPFVIPSGFVSVFHHERFCVLTTPQTPVQVRGSSAVIGRLYDRRRTAQSFQLPDDPGKIDTSTLIESAWGAYVAVQADASGRVTVLRDPSGALPCYAFRDRHQAIVVSDLDALRRCRVATPSVDWDFVGWHLGAGHLRVRETALAGLSEIPPGMRAVITSAGVHLEAIWSPWDFVDGNRRTPTENAEALRETIDACVAAMSRGLDVVHLGLSGGLDSSILATSLRRAQANVSAYTLITDDSVGDERPFAAIAADAFGMPLAEIPYRLEEIDLTRSVASHLPRPVGLSYQRPLYRYWQAQTGKNAAIVTGNGGDEVFCLMQSATPAVDLWLATRRAGATWAALRDVCRLTGAPMPAAVRQALKTLRQRKRPYNWTATTRFLSPEALTAAHLRQVDASNHPWLHAPAQILPGKKVHVANLLRLQHYVEGPPRSFQLPVLYPLLAQPVVELCLQIPTWQWSRDGTNRAVAREGFKDRLPPPLVRRHGKGGPETFAAQVYLAWRERLIPFLSDGLLAQNGIIDAAAVRNVLAVDAPPHGADYLRLLELADTEAWVRQMSAG
jgi:asparagine synthase (glutamine-hydrolysing)